MTEDYIRPPILAFEPASRRLVVWRFRVVLLVLLLAVAAGVFFMFRAITASNGDSDVPVVAPTTTSSPGVPH